MTGNNENSGRRRKERHYVDSKNCKGNGGKCCFGICLRHANGSGRKRRLSLAEQGPIGRFFAKLGTSETGITVAINSIEGTIGTAAFGTAKGYTAIAFCTDKAGNAIKAVDSVTFGDTIGTGCAYAVTNDHSAEQVQLYCTDPAEHTFWKHLFKEHHDLSCAFAESYG